MPVFTLPKSHHPDFALPNVKPKGPVEVDKGLSNYLLLNKAPWVDLASKVKNSSSALPTQIADNLTFNGSGNHLDYGSTSLPIDGSSKFTVSVRIKVNDTTADHAIVEKIGSAFIDGWILFFDIVGNDSVTDVFTLFIGKNPASNQERVQSSGFKTAGWYTITATFDGSLAAGSKCRMWVNGVEETNGYTGGTAPTDVNGSGETLYIGQHSNSSDRRYWDSDMEFVTMDDRVWGDSEILGLHSNYYFEILKPAIPLTYFVPAAAAAGGNEPLFYHHQRMLSRCS